MSSVDIGLYELFGVSYILGQPTSHTVEPLIKDTPNKGHNRNNLRIMYRQALVPQM